MKKPAALALMALFASSCSDPNEPPRYLNVETPDWAKSLNVTSVAKYSCRITNAAGESFNINRYGTDIGNGLTATRNYYHCQVASQGTKCDWNSSEKLTGCKVINPANIKYNLDKK